MKKVFIFLSLLFFVPLVVVGQTEMSSHDEEGLPKFFFDLVNVSSNQADLSRFNVYLEIPYDELQFLKVEDWYEAQYEVSVVILDQDKDQVDGKTWQEEVIVNYFNFTNSRRLYSLTHNSFHVEPGHYKISVTLMDLDTKREKNRVAEADARGFQNEKFSISDITFVDNITADSLGVKTIHPQTAESIRSLGTELYCYFEIYCDLNINEKFDVSYRVLSGKEVIDENQYQSEKIGPRNLEYFKLDKSILTHGKYTLQLEVKHGEYSDATEKNFTIRLIGMPSAIVDLDLAIEQLRYIASGEELSELKKAPKQEKLDKFEVFWKRRDPTIGSEINELKDEYYRRIQYSNDKFSTFRDGWQTDMGMIYILFGSPNDIERHPFERGYKPYEVWNYYDLNRQFIFIDETGFGDYRLSNPNWEHWHSGIFY